MSLFKGDKLTVEIYGESHAERIGGIVFGMPETAVDLTELKEFTDRRKAGGGAFSTTRIESDEPIFSGIRDGIISDEFSFYIKNENVKSGDYNNLYGKPRPSHADYAWHLKDGALDFSGGGRFSGRLTAPLCVIGGICKQYLEKKGIKIAAYISEIGKVKGESYKSDVIKIEDIIKERDGFPSLTKKSEMVEEISRAKAALDSVGGKIECVISGLKGAGDNLFGGIEGKISNLLFAIPAVKGVEFGLGFGFCDKRGGEVNDCMYYDEKGAVRFSSNNSGGINGGIANGEDITFSVAMRPTPSIGKEQDTIDLVEKKNVKIKISGRHDACIIPRAIPCVESAAAIALTDII